MTFVQDTADFYINHDTVVTITITTPCGQGAVHQIHVKMPDNLVHITDITADKVGCEPLVDVTLTPTIENIQGTPTYLWSNGILQTLPRLSTMCSSVIMFATIGLWNASTHSNFMPVLIPIS